MEMLDFGVFEGIYTHAIKGIPAKYKTHPNVLGDKGPDVSFNYFGVKSRQSLKEWQKKGWTTELSPLGWWEWYIKYFHGRRDAKEDALQIARWNSFVRRHSAQVIKHCRKGDKTCRPKQRQGLLQWAWDSNKPVTDEVLAANLKRIVKASGTVLGDKSQESLYTW
jgi:hypothetical protein